MKTARRSVVYTCLPVLMGLALRLHGQCVIQFAARTQFIPEEAGTAQIDVVREGDAAAAATVDYTTSDGTATGGEDYAVASGTLSFAAGETHKVISVAIVDDAQGEGDQAFDVRLDHAPSGAQLGVNSNVTVYILDNDPGSQNWAEWAWAKATGNAPLSSGRSLALDSQDNAFVTGGGFWGFPGYLAKIDRSGNEVWRRETSGFDMTTDLNGNALLIGTFEGQVSFGDTNNAATLISLTNLCVLDSMFLVKFDAAGNVVWAQQSGGNRAYGYAVTTDSAGNVYASGFFQNSATFSSRYATGANATNDLTTTLISNGMEDWYLVKFDANGNLRWAQNGGGGALATDKDGNVIAVNSTPPGFSVTHYNPTGNVLRVGSYTFGNNTIGLAVSPDGAGDIYTLCAEFNPNDPSNEALYLMKLDRVGQPLWTNWLMNGVATIRGLQLATTDDGEAYVVGQFEGSLTFGDTTLTAQGLASDICLVKYSQAGRVVWAKRVGGFNQDSNGSIALSATGDLWLTGFFNGDTVVGGTTLAGAWNSSFLARLASGLPCFVSQPNNVRTNEGGTVAFCVTVTNAWKPRYEWYKEGVKPVFYSCEGDRRGKSSKMACFHGFAEMALEM